MRLSNVGIATALVVLAASVFAAPPFAAAAPSGRIAGAIVTSSDPVYPADVLGIEANVRIVARTPAGDSVGTFRFGTPSPVRAGFVSVPYTIEGVPLGVDLHVQAERVVAAQPSPEPSGFYLMPNVRKSGGDAMTPYCDVTLTRATPASAGCNFTYAAIEVPPALPPVTPAASASPSSSPPPSSGRNGHGR